MASINLQGDTSGAITISAPSVAGSNTLTLPATTQTLATQNTLGVRNLIINGDMRIAQRGTSVAGITNGSGGYHTCDRWKFVESGTPTAVYTQTQDTDVPTGQGFATSLKMNCTTAEASVGAANQIYIGHILESQTIQHLKKGTANAESITISFWVKSNVTGTFVLGLQEFQNTRYNAKTYTVSASNTWEKKTLTFAGDTTGVLTNDNTAGLYVQFYLMAGTDYSSGTLPTNWETTVNANRAVGQVNLSSATSNYFNLTGIQLEVGDTATPFEHRPYDMELARCQRYYQLHDGMIAANGNEPAQLYPTISFKTAMRATPSVSQTGTIAFVRPSVANYPQSSVAVSIISATSTAARLSMQNYSGLATNQIYIQTTYGEYIQLNSEL